MSKPESDAAALLARKRWAGKSAEQRSEELAPARAGRQAALTPERRSEIAKIAAAVRHGKKKSAKRKFTKR